MRTKYSWVLITILLMFTLLGCGNTKETSKQISNDQAQAVFKEYKSQFYSTPPNSQLFTGSEEQIKELTEKYKIYFTSKGFDSFVANKVPIIPMEVVKKGRFKIATKGVTFNTVSATDGRVVFDYEVTISVLSPEKSSEKEVNESGQVTLVKVGTDWKIDNDSFTLNDLFKETLKLQ